MKPCIRDSAVYFKQNGNKLIGLCATYVDNTLHAGNKKYSKLSKQRETEFTCKIGAWDNLQFSDLHIRTCGKESRLSQKSNVKNMTVPRQNKNFSSLSSPRAKLSWASNSGPDIPCSVALLCQVTEETFNAPILSQKKAMIRSYVFRAHSRAVTYLSLLDEHFLRLQVYCDASVATNYDRTSQLEFIDFLADKHKTIYPLHWTSYKSKRVTRFVLGSEVMAFADDFDVTISLKT